MLSTAPGSVDGIRVASYEADQEYDLTATPGARDLAEAFVDAGLATEVGAEPIQQAAADAELPPGGADVEAAPAAKPARKPKAQ